MNERERIRIERFRAAQRLIADAAAWIRHGATYQEYAGFHNKELGYAVAAVFDVLELHLRDLPNPVAREVLKASQQLVHEAQCTAPGSVETPCWGQATRLTRSPNSYRASYSTGGLPPQAP